MANFFSFTAGIAAANLMFLENFWVALGTKKTRDSNGLSSFLYWLLSKHWLIFTGVLRYTPPEQRPAGAEDTGEAQLRNIRFDNCHLRCCGRVTILGNDKTRPDNIVIKDSSFTIVRRENFCKEHKRPTRFMWFQRADRISLIDTELIWESPDPEWQETSMFTDVRNLITRNCLLPELNR